MKSPRHMVPERRWCLDILTWFRFYYELRGFLSIFPPAEDNYGVDSCSIICFPTNPVVVAIAACTGTIYHCIALDSEDEDVFGKTMVSIVVLYVHANSSSTLKVRTY